MKKRNAVKRKIKEELRRRNVKSKKRSLRD